MKKFLALLFFPLMCGAQTVTIPQPDKITICMAASGLLSVCPTAGLTGANLTLTGGPALAPGTYILSVAAPSTPGAIPVGTFVPYVPSTSAASPGTVYTVAVPAQAAYALNWYLVPGATVGKGQVYSASPIFTGAPGAGQFINWQLFVNSAGALYLRLINPQPTAYAATSFAVSVK